MDQTVQTTSQLPGLAGSATEEALRQLVQHGFEYGMLTRVVLDLTRRTGHRPSIGEVLKGLVQSHPVGDLARTWSSAGTLVSKSAPSSEMELTDLHPPSLQRASTVPASGQAMPQLPPALVRTASLPAAVSATSKNRLRSQYAGASLEAVARLLLRAVHAEGSGRLSTEQCRLLKEQLRHGELDAVHMQLQQIQLSSDGLSIGTKAVNSAVDNPWFECPICFDEVTDDRIVQVPCQEAHRFCQDCLMHHMEAVAFPQCPHAQCRYEFTEEDVMRTCGDGARLDEFREMNLQRAIMRLHGRIECPNPACSNVVIGDPERRTCVKCVCGWPAFCSMCRQPYHYHSTCAMVQPLRSRWLEWISVGRAEYHGLVAGLDEVTEKHQAAVQVAVDRHRELEADEEWKGEMCRLCPKCFRAIQRTEGCNSMVCGRNYHGGNQQQGCGHTFNWSSAPKYQPRVGRQFALPKLEFCSEAKAQGAYVKHMFTSCNLCQKRLRGPRFHCIHCEAFDCCIDCEPQLAEIHSPEHVFDILFEPSDPINIDLLVGTRVEVHGLEGSASTLNGITASIARYLPDILSYELDLPFASGQGIVPAKNLQPADVADAAEAQEVLEQSLAQQDARRLHLNLRQGQLVQLCPQNERPELHNTLGTVVQYRPLAIPKYLVELKSPPDWACNKGTLNNSAHSMNCAACGTARSQFQGTQTWVRASELAPLISCADDVKELAIQEFLEQGRLIKVEMANQQICESVGETPLDLPVHQQVLCLQESTSTHGEDALGEVLSYIPWCRSYKISLEDPVVEVKLPASHLRPVFWRADEPMNEAKLCTHRHEEEVERLAKVARIHEQLQNIFLGLPPTQHVIFTPLGREQAGELLPAALCSGMGETAVGMDNILPATIVEFCAVRRIYTLAPVHGMDVVLRVKEVAAECVRPVLWNSTQPAEEAELLIAAHEAESRRLSQAVEANTYACAARLGLPEGSLIEDEGYGGQQWRVKRYIRTDSTYSVMRAVGRADEARVFAACRIHPVFWDAPDPLAAASAAVQADSAEALRLKACADAEKLAAGCFLGLPTKSLVRLANKMLCKITTFSPASLEYEVESVNAFGQKSFCSLCAQRIDGQKNVVTTSSAKQSYCWCAGNQTHRIVACRDVQPVFLLEDDPLESAARVCKVHAEEVERFEAMQPAHAATEHGGFLALKSGQLVCLIGEGVWRRPTAEHNGHAHVCHYHPESQVYDVNLVDFRKYSKSCSSDSVISVNARYLKPLFLESQDPGFAVQQVRANHETERQRLRAVREAAHRCSDVYLGFPEGTHVVLRPTSSHFKDCQHRTTHLLIDSWCKFSQQYAIKKKWADSGSGGLSKFSVIASDVQPSLWLSQDPDEECDTLIKLHEAEEVRLQQVKACENEFRNGGTLGLPAGFPVRLLESLPVSKLLDPPKPSSSWKSWLKSAMPSYAPQGCAVSDIAVVLGYNLDGTYCLAVQNCAPQWELTADADDGPDAGTVVLPGQPWGRFMAGMREHRVNGVQAAAVQPCCRAARNPRALAGRLRERHASAQERLDSWKKVTMRIDSALLALPPGTSIVADGIGQCFICTYDARGPGYVIRAQFGSAVTYALADRVKPTCLDADDPASRLAHFAALHEAELQRLNCVREANERTANLHENLPLGTEVEISSRAASLRHDQRDGQPASIMRCIAGDPARYSLKLYSPTATCVSSDSYIDVLASEVRPVFWASPQPLEDAEALLQTCRN